MTIDFKQYGHDGYCDNEGEDSPYCDNPATAAVVSAVVPDMWEPGSPAASIAFLCPAHLTCEPIAQREHAEHIARQADGPGRDLWDKLLAAYPTAVPLTR